MQDLGAKALIAGFVLSLFVSIPFGPASIEELSMAAAVVVFVLASGEIRISFRAAALPVILGLAGALSSAIGYGWYSQVGRLTFRMMAIGLVVGLVVPVLRKPDNLRFFARALVWIGAVSAVVTILQRFDVLPLYGASNLAKRTLASSGELRATGFQYDPIFQAIILSASAGVVPFIIRRRSLATALLLVMSVGVWSTVTRMGWVLLLMVPLLWVLIGPVWQDARWRRAVIVLVAGLIAVPGIVLVGADDLVIDAGTTERVDETRSSLARFSELGAEGLEEVKDRTSTESRIVLINGALESIAENWTIGVGTGWTLWDLFARTGVQKDAHNTYLELVQAVGVPIGLAVLVVWFRVFLRAVRRTRSFPVARAPVAAAAVFGVGFLMLNNTFATLFFVPWVVGLAVGQMQAEDRLGASSPVLVA